MLQSKRGATIAAMTRATGWQAHSIRGFLAGVVKKKLELNLLSEKTKFGRLYRVVVAEPRLSTSAETASGSTHA